MPSPASITLHRSNRTELLAEQLCGLLEEPVGGPLEPEWLVVQSHGMSTWLSLELARRHGIWAHGEFLFPRRFVERAYAAVVGEADAAAPAGVERLMWAVSAALPALLGDSRFGRLQRYIGEDPRGVRRYQLARRIAVTFDQYLTYRPDMVRGWEGGADDTPGGRDQAWQPLLWRAVIGRVGAGHVAAREHAFLAALQAGAEPTGLPRRVAVFGISSLPPLYVRAFTALAARVDVHMFLLSPSAEHWSELITPREAARLLRTGGGADDLHLDVDNPMLASLGGLGAEFTTVLAEACERAGVAESEHDHYVEPDAGTLLGRLQSDILHLRRPGEAGEVGEAGESGAESAPARDASGHPMLPFGDSKPAAAVVEAAAAVVADDTIVLHACHGAMREVEVLRDQVLGLLDADPTLEPRDILVMMADVDAYAPLVEAVFTRDDRSFVPYRIADRTFRSESAVVEAVQRILGMVGGRAPASEVLDLLRLEPVHRRFSIRAADLEQLSQWVAESGIRWGLDAAHRERNSQPPLRENTWEFGLDRMLLGYAMPTAGTAMFGDVLPYDEIEGHDAQRLGRLAEFCAQLFGWLRRLEEPRLLPEWRDAVAAMLEAVIVHDPDHAWHNQRIRGALTMLVEEASAAGFDEPVDVAVLRALIEPRLDEAHPERGFLGGGITFCAFLPMRSIPFRVVCMLGMSDGAFPRVDRPVDFDLLSSGGRRAGDRSRRADDRYLFLEALLSARDRVLITYNGQSIRDNAKLPPSVVVSELLDFLEQTVGASALRDRLMVAHPLQPFSRRYFDAPVGDGDGGGGGGDSDSDSRLFSYEQAYVEGARSLRPDRGPAPPLFAAPLPAAPDAEPGAAIEVEELVRFYRSPVGYLLNRRLRIYLDDRDSDVEDSQPLVLDPLTKYAIGERMLGLASAELGVELGGDTLELERAHGTLAPGAVGAYQHETVLRTASEIAAHAAALCPGDVQPPLSVDVDLEDGTRLLGVLEGLGPAGMLRRQFSRVKIKDLLAMWVRHLVLCSAAPEGVPMQSVLIGRPPSWWARWNSKAHSQKNPPTHHCARLESVDDPGAELAVLVELFRAGLRAPLRLLPETSFAYAQARRSGDDEASALRVAIREWGASQPVDRYDQHLVRVFGTAQPPFEEVVTDGPPFDEVARQVLGAMLRHLTEQAG